MSRTPSLLLILLLASGITEPLALAEGATLATTELALTPSLPPRLLGPILSSGRTGWHCEAELAASSQQPKGARLPNEVTN
jgi:hypothetical protein